MYFENKIKKPHLTGEVSLKKRLRTPEDTQLSSGGHKSTIIKQYNTFLWV